MSKRTKHCKSMKILFSLLHLICLFLPLIISIPQAFAMAQGAKQVGLTFSLISALCIGLISIFVDAKYKSGFQKSILWVILIGLAITLNEIKTLLMWIAILSIIDELLVIRLRDLYKTKFVTNKEIDLRGTDN